MFFNWNYFDLKKTESIVTVKMLKRKKQNVIHKDISISGAAKAGLNRHMPIQFEFWWTM